MIKAQNITKSFGKLQVLKGIDLEVKRGEIVTIVGQSGAGKTTFLQILGTLSQADGGTISFENVVLNNLTNSQIAKFRNQKIGFVFQFHHLLPEFTALENVCIPAFIAKTNKKNAETRALELLKFLNLDHRSNHKPSELSGGEQQRVAVARALINQPDVILADEPSGNLDTASKNELHELFFTLRDKYNQTFIIVTHDIQLANRSDRVIMMKDGVIV